MLTIGSLFSGIGGLELGLEWAGLGSVRWQVERDPWCRRVLAHHWPDAERHEDVCAVGAEQLAPVDLMCGGFPCQDVSSAGKRKGLSGSRSGLWWQFDRIVGELAPEWVIVENVASGAGRWVDAVRDALGERGYETLPIPMRASDVGAPHRRARVFIVGRLVDAEGQRRQARSEPGPGEPRRGLEGPSDRRARVAHGRVHGCEGSPTEHGAHRDLGIEQGRDAVGRDSGRLANPLGEPIRDAKQRRPRRRSRAVRDQGEPIARLDGSGRGRDAEPLVGRDSDGLPAGLDALTHASARPVRWPAPRGAHQHKWEPRRAVPASALTDRGPRLHALGNAVVPQCAEVVGWIVRELLDM